MESQNNISSCAAGFARNGHHCSHDMFAELNAPGGWFESLCPVTCGTCPDDGSSGPDASPPPSPCADDDATLAQYRIMDAMSCYQGYESNGHHCSNDMFIDSGLPHGMFESLCPVTCGTCPDGGGGAGDGSNYDASPPSPDSGSSLFPTPSHCADDDATLAIVTHGTIPSCADGVAMSSDLCSDDGFTSLCPVTCGTCSDAARWRHQDRPAPRANDFRGWTMAGSERKRIRELSK